MIFLKKLYKNIPIPENVGYVFIFTNNCVSDKSKVMLCENYLVFPFCFIIINNIY